MEEEIKRWTARHKSSLVMEFLQGKTTVAEAIRQFDLTPSENEGWVDSAKAGRENALKDKLEDTREQYERQLEGLRKPMARSCLSRVPEDKLQCWLGNDES